MRAASQLICLALLCCVAPQWVSANDDPQTDSPDLPPAQTAPAAYLGLMTDDATQGRPGLRVLNVVNNGPAYQGGVRSGDIIVSLQGQPVSSPAEMQAILEPLAPGAAVDFVINRFGTQQSLHVTLGHRPAGAPLGPAPVPSNDTPPGPNPQDWTFDQTIIQPRLLLGIRTLPMTPDVRALAKVPVEHGALVTEVLPGTPADRAGIQTQSIIVGVDNTEVRGPSDLSYVMAQAKPRQVLDIALYYLGEMHHVKVQLDDAPAVPQGLRPGETHGPLDVRNPPLNPEAEIEALRDQIQTLQARLAELMAQQKQPRSGKQGNLP
jgi:predicted metalloprotease with PDZ domain